MTLTIREAAEYSNIGINKIDTDVAVFSRIVLLCYMSVPASW